MKITEIQIQNSLRTLSHILREGTRIEFLGGDLVVLNTVIDSKTNPTIRAMDNKAMRTQDLSTILHQTYKEKNEVI